MTDNFVSSNEQSVNKTTEVMNGNEAAINNEDPNTAIKRSQITIRSLVSSKEAGVIIGKGGNNVTEIREITGARAGVSKVVQGIPTRVLTISGTLEAVSNAFGRVARSLIENIDSSNDLVANVRAGTNTASVRILIAHSIMGTIIGKQGSRIKKIQEISGSRMIATKEILANSTERVVEIQGNPEAISLAIFEIGRSLLQDQDKLQGTIYYNPLNRPPPIMSNSQFYPNFPPNFPMGGLNGDYNYLRNNQRFGTDGPRFDNLMPHPHVQPHINPDIQALHNGTLSGLNNLNSPLIGVPPLLTKKLTIAADMVGCVIGKHGSKIAEIRRLSNAKISIAKETESENNTRLFTIQGTQEANDTAIYLISAQLEAEKERRSSQSLSNTTIHDESLQK